MATSGITSSTPVAPVPPGNRVASPSSVASASADFAAALSQTDPVVAPSWPSRSQVALRGAQLQARPEYAMVMLMAQRPGQLRKLFESLGGPAASMDVGAATAELESHLESGGSLAAFGARQGLDATTLYLLGIQVRIAHQKIKRKWSGRLEHELDELLSGHETEVNAALNTSRAMRTLAGSASDRMWMRSLYVSAITVRNPISETFESLLQRFGTSGFEQGAKTLLRAFNEDIASHRASVAPDRLQGLLLASMVAMRHVLGLIHSSQGFLRRQGFDIDEAAPDGKDIEQSDPRLQQQLHIQQGRAEALTIKLVRLLLQMTVTANAVKAVPEFIVQDMGNVAAAEDARRRRTHFLELVKALPTSLWKEANHKDQLVDAIRRLFESESIQRALPEPSRAGRN